MDRTERRESRWLLVALSAAILVAALGAARGCDDRECVKRECSPLFINHMWVNFCQCAEYAADGGADEF